MVLARHPFWAIVNSFERGRNPTRQTICYCVVFSAHPIHSQQNSILDEQRTDVVNQTLDIWTAQRRTH